MGRGRATVNVVWTGSVWLRDGSKIEFQDVDQLSGFLWIMCILQAVSRRAVLLLYSSREIGGSVISAISAPDFFLLWLLFSTLGQISLVEGSVWESV